MSRGELVKWILGNVGKLEPAGKMLDFEADVTDATGFYGVIVEKSAASNISKSGILGVFFLTGNGRRVALPSLTTIQIEVVHGIMQKLLSE